MTTIELCKELASEIFNDLGSGFDEPIYQKAFEVSLRIRSIPYESQKIIPITYRGYNVGEGKIDLLIHLDDNLVIELKAIVTISPKDETQLKKYMELTNIHKGLLINFPQFGTAKKERSIIEPEYSELIQ